MLLPIQAQQAWSANTYNQVGQAIDILLRESERALAAARRLMAVIDEELNQRRNRTCLLLPKENYGKYFGDIMACVRNAATRRQSDGEFRAHIRRVAERLPRDSKGRYVGRKNLAFEPTKAQHGQPPFWNDDGKTPAEHLDSCVIRGRVRFGVPFDPKIHYDCKLPNAKRGLLRYLYRHAHTTPYDCKLPNAKRGLWARSFQSCHGPMTLKRERSHANIAPNDNVR